MKSRIDLILGISLMITLLFLTIGYASYDQLLSLNSDIVLKKPGTIQITKIEQHSSDLPTNSGSLGLNSDGSIKLDYSFKVSQAEKNYTATYLLTIENNSPYEYTFSGFNIQPTTTITGTGANSSNATAILTYEITNLNLPDMIVVGDNIPINEKRIVAVTIFFYVASQKNNTTIGVGGSAGVNTTVDNTGNIYGGIYESPVTLDLSGDNIRDCFYVDVTNTYKTEQNYYFSLTTNSFNLVDENGLPLSTYTISPPSENSDDNTQHIKLCMEKKDGSIFASNLAKTQVVINPTGLSNFSVGTISIEVDASPDAMYDGTPKVQNVKFSTNKYDQDTSSLLTTVSWDRKDTDPIDVDSWYIALYSDYNDQLINTFELDGTENISNYELVISNTILNNTNFTSALNNNSNFYVKVYGRYSNRDSGEGYCTDITDYCVASDSISLNYKFTLTYTGNVTMSNTTNRSATIYLNNSFTSLITATEGYALTGITVTKGSGDTQVELTNGTEYNYSLQENSSSVADFSINENVIDDNITIAITSTNADACLIKGTEIKVLGGYKNIEDIKYDDLLVVYSYELGKEVYEYPIKIEQEGFTDHYQKITFSDGSVLNTFSSHGIFSRDANKFVSVLDRDNFDIGTNIVKVENGELKEVKVVNIEEIQGETTYYNISSTRYLNVIANGFITTDTLIQISNIFSFNDDLTWGSDREEYLKTEDFISYTILKNFFPKYLYEGIRMKEAKHLLNQGLINIPEYVTRFYSLDFVPIPTDEDGNNKWMVTTSLDLENNSKGNYYKEGSTYELPKAKKIFDKEFVGWYCSADNKYYQEGELVKVNYGMYFEAIYK